MAEKLGLVSGLSLDLTVNDTDGEPWDFNVKEKRDKAERLIRSKKALLLIGSPMCTAFSQLQHLNFSKMSKHEIEQVIEHGTRHLEFCMHLYRIQVNQGMYFLHEHPEQASSWHNEKVKGVLNMKNVRKVTGHMCAFGMLQGNQLVKKPTSFMSNCDKLLSRLEKKCDAAHRHILLVGGRAKRAQVYPDELCKEMLHGLMEQMEDDGRLNTGLIGMMGPTEEGDVGFWDDVSGKQLRTQGVWNAGAEEITEFRKFNVYVKRPISECYEVTGKAPLGIRWIDINKGDDLVEELRSRLVAKEIKRDKREDLFAATPPLEALKMLLSLAVTEGFGHSKGNRGGGDKIDFIDVKRAYFK